MTSDLEFAAGLARRAGDLLMRYYRRSGVAVTLKADRSVVTEADVASDRLVAAQIQAAYPDDGLVSEELKPSAVGQFPPAVWVVDPLDGTTNFSLGLHIWGVLLARLVDGFPVTAALYFPLVGELYTASRGGGAWLNGEPIHTRPLVKDHPAPYFACCGRTHRRYNVNVPFKPRIFGSSAYTLCSVARGVAVLGFEAAPKLWDLAGAWLLVQEAGGVIESYNEHSPFPLTPGTDYDHVTFPTLAAADTGMIARGRDLILPKTGA